MDLKQEDKLIGTKLKALNQLPEGYVPDFDSKWAILEAGLDTKRKRFVYLPWIAATFLILGGVATWLKLYKPSVVSKNQLVNEWKVKPRLIESSPKVKYTMKGQHLIKRVNTITSSDKSDDHVINIENKLITITSSDTGTIYIPPNNSIISESKYTNVVPRSRKKQFVTLDFGISESKDSDSSPLVNGNNKFTFNVFKTEKTFSGNPPNDGAILNIKKDF